ncbi:hypothetical protein [Brevibacillus massiliensis]|uniref:hypothetical protein n=1 Tax=Brevibacillus massiliensis TaxID=1118054 RepID=UPI000319633A|nr:hypothetical protein [Brevibacillus massiliensis]
MAAKSARPVCVIASGINRVDEKKVLQSEGEKIEKANADEVLKFTGYVIVSSVESMRESKVRFYQMLNEFF